MSSLKETHEAFQSFLDNTKSLTNLYKGEELGKILYSCLLGRKRDDGLVGFGPRDIWNVSNEELIKLVKSLEEEVRSQASDQ